MDIEKLKSGRPKPVFVTVLELVMLGTVGVIVLIFLGAYAGIVPESLLGLFEFLAVIEVGVLSVFYGAEGIKYGFIWLTYPTLSGPRRIGFGKLGSTLIGLVYVLMGLGFMVAAIMFAYLNGKPS